jgi:serine/threonine-protein kinase
MSTGKFAALKSIFSHALELRDEEVASYLEAACGADPQLRARVEEMLREAKSPATALITEAPREPMHLLEMGIVLAGRFELKEFLGRGGMGEVYLAEDRELGGPVALKTIRMGLLDTQGTARFRREVQLARQVTHEGICRVFDVGRESIEGRELVFFTMEFVPGETLRQLLQRKGKLSAEEARPLLAQLAAALQALHAKGIVHRDLKPANVMVDGGRLCLTDFGLARAFEDDEAAGEYTQTGAILGTPGYMAPEQLAGETATPASDVYAFGVVAYEMLTGQRAAQSDDLAAGRTGLAVGWEEMILACVAKNPASRPASAIEAMALLDRPAPVAKAKPHALALWAMLAVVAVVAAGLGWRQSGEQRARDTNGQILRARQLMMAYFKGDNGKQARKILEEVVQAEPKLALGHAALCAALHRMSGDTAEHGLVERAREECTQAVALDPDMAEAHVTLGLIYLNGGRRDLARSELKRAQELDARLPEVHYGLAQLYRAEGRIAEQDRAIQTAIDLAPENWLFRNWRGLDYRDRGKTAEALKELEAADRILPDNPLVKNNIGVTYLQAREFAKAVAAFEESNRLTPRARTLGNLGTAYYQLKDYDAAARTLKQAVELDPKSYQLRANYAAALDRNPARHGEAGDAYRAAIALAQPWLKATPNDFRLLGNVATFYAYVGDRENAVALIRKADALRPDSIDVALRAIAVYEYLKDRPHALEWAAEAMKRGQSKAAIQDDPELADLVADPRFKKLEVPSKER